MSILYCCLTIQNGISLDRHPTPPSSSTALPFTLAGSSHQHSAGPSSLGDNSRPHSALLCGEDRSSRRHWAESSSSASSSRRRSVHPCGEDRNSHQRWAVFASWGGNSRPHFVRLYKVSTLMSIQRHRDRKAYHEAGQGEQWCPQPARQQRQ